jgi:CheY-like chemotaxis protein
VSVVVRDNGIGIPAEMLPQIFDLFTQVDATSNRAQGGLGIGLTLVRSLVEMHGGTVAARSAGPNTGSEFEVRLPLLQPAEVRERGGSAAADAPRVSHPRRRVMVVDDNRDAAETLTAFLRDAGHEVDITFDGESALRKALEFRPDLMLVDIGLPRMTGHELVQQLRASPALARTIFVAVTGYGQDHDRNASRAAGFDDHWTKPLDPESLLTYMDALPATKVAT